MIVISARKIQDGIQRGFGYDQFMEKYDCSKEEVKKSVSAAYKRSQADQNNILKQIEKNSKKNSKSAKNTQSDTQSDIKPNAQPNAQPIIGEPKIASADIPASPESKPTKSLSSLKRHEKNLSDIVQTLESERKALVAKRREEYVELSSLQEKFVRLKNQFEEALETFDAKSRQIEEFSQQISVKTSEINAEKLKLYEVRSEIETLSEITAFVYESGEIELSNGEFYDMVTEFSAKALELAQNPICKDLKIKEIQALSNVIAIKQDYQDSEFNIQFVFDNENVELVFNTL